MRKLALRLAARVLNSVLLAVALLGVWAALVHLAPRAAEAMTLGKVTNECKRVLRDVARLTTSQDVLDEELADVRDLTPTDNAAIVGNGTAFVAESGNTLRTSLGLAIGTDVQAQDADLTALAGLARTQGDLIYGSDTQWSDLPAGTAGHVLSTAGAGANPSWIELRARTLDVQTSTSATSATYSVPGGTLGVDEDALLIIASGVTDGSGTEEVQLTFGATELVGTSVTASSNNWLIVGFLVRTGATSQAFYGLRSSGTTGTITTFTNVTAAETLSGAVNLVVNYAAGESTDLVHFLHVQKLRAP